MINYKYQVNLYSPFIENENFLNDLYLPIIGKEAVALYKILKYEYLDNYNLFMENKSNDKLLRKWKLSWDEFNEQRKKLESVGLLKTFLDELNTTFYYILKEPLNFEEFMTNIEMSSILKNRTTNEEFKKIQVKFSKFIQSSNMVDVSETIDYLITETEIRDLFLFNFEKLYEKLANKYHTNFSFPHNTKKIIDNFYNQNYSEFDLIYKMVDESIITINNEYIISEKLLRDQMDKYISNKQEQEIIIRTSIKRNHKIFNPDEDLNQFLDVIRDYKKHTSENYIVITTKQSITHEIQVWVNELRNVYNLNDNMINPIIDYTNIQNNGLLHKNFIIKIAQTVNSKALNTTEEVVEHLRNWNNKKKTNNVYSAINSQIEQKTKKINSNLNLENEYNFADYDEEQLAIIKTIG